MANETVTLTRERALQVKGALKAASDVVLALEWIGSQSADMESMGALQAIKSCCVRLDAAILDSCEMMEEAIANQKGACHD